MLTGRALVATAIISTFFLLVGWGDEGRAQEGDARESGSPESVTLELEGEEGASFSGVCSVGEERSEIGGEVPQSFEFDVADGRKLACEIRKKGERNAALEIALSGEGSRSVQRIEGEEGTVRLTYEGGAVSSSMSSASSDSAGDRTSTDGAPEEDGESLADRVQRMVDDILEQVVQ